MSENIIPWHFEASYFGYFGVESVQMLEYNFESILASPNLLPLFWSQNSLVVSLHKQFSYGEKDLGRPLAPEQASSENKGVL